MTTVLGIAAIVLLFALVFYIAKTSELAGLIKRNDAEDDYEQTSSYQGVLWLVFGVLFFGGIGVSTYVWGPRMLPEAASVHGVQTDAMFNLTLAFTFIVFVVTHLVLFWFSFRYRYKKNRQAAYITHNNAIEVVWTLIPSIVMFFLVFKGIGTWQGIFNKDNVAEAQESMEVMVIAKQFGWIIWYPGEDGEFGKQKFDNEHVTNEYKGIPNLGNELGIDWDDPASHDDLIYVDKLYFVKEKPVLVKLGAQDVLHSFYLPHFRVKMDCVPGTPTQFPFTPLYTTEEYRERLKYTRFWGQEDENGNPRYESFNFELACTELCGKSHYAMRKEVVVLTEEEYKAKLSEMTPYYEMVIRPELAKAGYVEPLEVEEVEPSEESSEAEEGEAVEEENTMEEEEGEEMITEVL